MKERHCKTVDWRQMCPACLAELNAKHAAIKAANLCTVMFCDRSKCKRSGCRCECHLQAQSASSR